MYVSVSHHTKHCAVYCNIRLRLPPSEEIPQESRSGSVPLSSFQSPDVYVRMQGESAGAGSVLQHIVANEGNTQPPLFQAAMTSSTYLPFQYDYNDTIPEVRPSI